MPEEMKATTDEPQTRALLIRPDPHEPGWVQWFVNDLGVGSLAHGRERSWDSAYRAARVGWLRILATEAAGRLMAQKETDNG